MKLIITLPLAFALFTSVLAFPATSEPAEGVDFHVFPEFAGFDNFEQIVGNDTESDIEERDPAAVQAGQCTLANLKKIMFDYSKSSFFPTTKSKDQPPPPPYHRSQITNTHHLGMSVFQSARAAKSPSCFDWYSNACTLSPDRPLGFNFIPPCQRHDFGDTNFAKKNQWNPVNKLRTDWRFRTDMWAVCDKLTGWKNVLKRATCMVVANKYADAVVVFNPATDL